MISRNTDRTQRWSSGPLFSAHHAGQHFFLASRRIGRDAGVGLQLADLMRHAGPLVHQLDDLLIDAIDLCPLSCERWQARGRCPLFGRLLLRHADGSQTFCWRVVTQRIRIRRSPPAKPARHASRGPENKAVQNRTRTSPHGKDFTSPQACLTGGAAPAVNPVISLGFCRPPGGGKIAVLPAARSPEAVIAVTRPASRGAIMLTDLVLGSNRGVKRLATAGWGVYGWPARCFALAGTA